MIQVPSHIRVPNEVGIEMVWHLIIFLPICNDFYGKANPQNKAFNNKKRTRSCFNIVFIVYLLENKYIII